MRSKGRWSAATELRRRERFRAAFAPACETGGKIKAFANVFKGSLSLRHRLSRFVARMGIAPTESTTLMAYGAELLPRLKEFLPSPHCVLDYFHMAIKVRHVDQCIGTIAPYRFSPHGSIFELHDRGP